MLYELSRLSSVENTLRTSTRLRLQQQALSVLPLAICSFNFSQESLGTAQLT